MMFDIKLLREKLSNRRVVVIGDVCLDWYLFIDNEKSEISVETGKQTRPVQTSRYSPGGAGNVAANLASLGFGTVTAIGVTGDDPFAAALGDALTNRGIVNSLVTQTGDWHTCVYTKLVEDAEEDRRIDFGNYNRLSGETEEKLIDSLEKALRDCDLCIINQQLVAGIHTPSFRARLAETIRRFDSVTFFTDSRDYPEAYDQTIRKLNEREAALCAGVDPETVSIADVPSVAKRLASSWKRPVIVTRGALGCVVVDDKGIHDVPGIDAGDGEDIVGAGDAFLAGLVCGFACDLDLETSAYLGNFSAAVTVAKRFQTGTASFDEIEAIAAEPIYRFNAASAMAGRSERRYAGECEIEIITGRSRPEFKCAVFDHDGTISTLRQGWELVMEPMMIDAIRGDAAVSTALAEKITRRVRHYIDVTTGIQTISQMIGLVDIIRDFGLVPEAEIKTPQEYKAVYNDALLKQVRRRTEKLENGELAVSDVTVKGAVGWLERLASKGVRLYLASGTDEADVVAEAKLLGYAELFAGRIYGATGSVDDEPKKRALKRILDDVGSTTSIVTFGDGPVEMRETVRRGGYAVGIASDEIRRYGFNESKRRRLVLAGADILIPDFSQSELIYGYLFEAAGGSTGEKA